MVLLVVVGTQCGVVVEVERGFADVLLVDFVLDLVHSCHSLELGSVIGFFVYLLVDHASHSSELVTVDVCFGSHSPQVEVNVSFQVLVVTG